MNDEENFEVKICENQSWGLHQCTSKSIGAIFKMNVDNKRLAITKELLSTDDPIYYYSYSISLKGTNYLFIQILDFLKCFNQHIFCLTLRKNAVI